MGVYGSSELKNNGDTYYEKNMIYCSKCGFRYSKNFRKCPQCEKKHSTPFYNKWWFWVLVVLVIFAFYPQQHRENNDNAQAIVSTEEYKASCVSVAYDDLARNPNMYLEQSVFFTGQVVQVQENDNNVALRINVTQNEYGVWVNTIYVDYRRKSPDESRILEQDIVTVYGKMNGIKSYKSVLGNQVSIPYLIAEYIELGK